MKRMKLFVLMSAVMLVSVQAFAGVGTISKDDIRDGTLMCEDATPKELPPLSPERQNHDEHPAQAVASK